MTGIISSDPISPLNNDDANLSQLVQNIKVISDAHVTGKLLGYKVRGGRVVAYEYSKFNIFRRFANWLYEKEQKSLAGRIAIETVSSLHSNAYKSEKKLISNFLKVELCLAAKLDQRQKVEDLFNSAVNQALQEDPTSSQELRWGEKNRLIYQKFTDNFLSSSIPKVPITLFDSKEFLEFRHNALIHNNPALSKREKYDMDTVYYHLKRYYDSTHLTDEFEDMEIEMKSKMVFALSESPHFALETNENLQNFCNDVIENIRHKIIAAPSVHGHPRELITSQELKFLDLRAGISLPSLQDLQEAKNTLQRRIGEYADICRRLRSLNHPPTPEQLPLIVEGKQALLALELSESGRKFNLKEISENSGTLDQTSMDNLKLLFECEKIRGDDVDLAVLQAICKEHDKAPIHPRVAVEGGGPTGLLLGITQYQVGANVSVFEKRSTDFDRTQVVRLDPKWVNMLQFYLGEKFNKLFVDNDHRGVFRPDGFVEIVTRNLEDALTQRLAELTSMASSGTLEEFAAHEVKDVVGPTDAEGKFRVAAGYVQEQDRLGRSPKPELSEEREVEFLFCAGGKSSQIVKTFLPSSHPVNKPEYYGVCSWLTADYEHFKGQAVDQMTYFQDFRGMVKIDSNLIRNFKEEALRRISKIDFGLDDWKVQFFYNQFDNLYIDYWTNRPFLQTRTFENKGMIYIGMELPDELERLIAGIAKRFENDPDEAKKVIAEVRAAWFEQIRKNYKLGDDLQIDSKFLATFPVEQNRLAPDHLYSEVKFGDSRLLITAAGDAFASPHFMRYSGLTGARENIIHLQDYMRGHIYHPEIEQTHLQELKHKGDVAAKFVIGRGSAFLRSKWEKQIENERIEHMRQLLDEASKNWKDADSTLRVISPDGKIGITFPPVNYVLKHKNVTYVIKAEAGYLTVVDQANTKDQRRFESIQQLKLTLGIK